MPVASGRVDFRPRPEQMRWHLLPWAVTRSGKPEGSQPVAEALRPSIAASQGSPALFGKIECRPGAARWRYLRAAR